MTDIKNPAGIDCCSIAYTVRHKQVVPNYRFGFMVTSLLLNSLLVGCQCYCKRASKLVYSFTCNTLANSQATCKLVYLFTCNELYTFHSLTPEKSLLLNTSVFESLPLLLCFGAVFCELDCSRANSGEVVIILQSGHS